MNDNHNLSVGCIVNKKNQILLFLMTLQTIFIQILNIKRTRAIIIHNIFEKKFRTAPSASGGACTNAKSAFLHSTHCFIKTWNSRCC